MAPSCVLTSMPLVQKGGPCFGSARLQPGRLLDQGPHPSRRQRKADDAGADAGSAPRVDRSAGPDGARSGQAAGPRTTSLRPDRIVGDKGYSYPHIRRYLRERGVRITIARRSNQHRGGPFDKAIYRLRNRVERLINRMKHFRRLATRYEKRAENYRAMWLIAAILLWL